mmetsp:Transcript_68772/g.164094  ORF Transcript_68772/g.164094 Transcript_68772/m.164094 type:complete len:226 (+) Transcript_68772:173-850(+)
MREARTAGRRSRSTKCCWEDVRWCRSPCSASSSLATGARRRRQLPSRSPPLSTGRAASANTRRPWPSVRTCSTNSTQAQGTSISQTARLWRCSRWISGWRAEAAGRRRLSNASAQACARSQGAWGATKACGLASAAPALSHSRRGARAWRSGSSARAKGVGGRRRRTWLWRGWSLARPSRKKGRASTSGGRGGGCASRAAGARSPVRAATTRPSRASTRPCGRRG